MKLLKKAKVMLLFFLVAIFCATSFSCAKFENLLNDDCKMLIANAFNVNKFGEKAITNKTQNNNSNYEYEFCYNGKVFYFKEADFKKLNLNKFQQNARNCDNKQKLLTLLDGFGLSQKEKILYLFPEIETMLKKLKNSLEKETTKTMVYVVKNSCEIDIEDGENGLFLNEEKFFNAFETEFLSEKKHIKINLEIEEYSGEQTGDVFQEKSCFSTNFESSSNSRKNNIRVALAGFDGFVLEDGEVLSFNNVTGERNEQAGYQKAKIISNGTFVDGFGGGVCQVSTTIYNACLLAGLEILEVHNHSLPVSYIEPSFDAMVNSGSSDLVVRNNSGGKLIFTTSSKNDRCKVKIFGKPNEYKIIRFSEKTKIIPAEIEEIITDPETSKNLGVLSGETKRLSYKKDGFESNGYLNYYNKNGELVETKKIRSNKYHATKGVVVKNIGN